MAFYTFENKNYTKNDVVRTAIDSVMGISSKAEFTAEGRKEAINQILRDLVSNYREHKNKLFEIIEETLNATLPKKIADAFRFAEVKEFKEGDTPAFTIKNGRIKAYWVAQGGTVRRHRKDKERIVVPTEIIQAKVYEELSRIQAGLVDFNELIADCEQVVLDAIKEKVHQTLTAVLDKLPAANKHIGAGVDADELKKLIAIVKSYGSPVMYGTFAGLSQLPEQKGSVASMEEIRKRGYDNMWSGTPTMEMENYTTDETNSKFQISDKYLFIFPEGNEKAVKIGFEGGTLTRETNGADWTIEWELLRKVSVAIAQNHFFAVYVNTNLE